MQITKRKPNLKLENDLSKKLQFSTDFSQNYTKHSSTIAAMVAVDVPWDWIAFRMKAYQYIVKVTSLSFLLVTASAQQREDPACGWIPLPPPPPRPV